jgi:protein-tyrosine-phosphatase
MLGEDPLATHRPSRLPDGLIEDADLILVMDDAVLNEAIRTRYPPAKTHLLKRFFGSDGDIADPWPDGDDAKTNRKYADCAAELRAAIEPNLDRLIEFLESR